MKRLIIIIIGMLVAGASAYCQSPAIQVTKSGKGKPVIFLPGFTCPGSVWNETVSHLERKKQNHIVSYAGFNGLAPIDMPWYETIKKELVAYIEKENLTDVNIMGHSMGGTLAVDIASELPDRIKGIVLVDALPCMRDLMMPGVPASQIKYESPYNEQLLKMSDEAFGKNASMMAGFMTNNKQKTDTLIRWSMVADRKTYAYGYTDLLKLDLRDALTKVKATTLILGASFPDKDMALATYNKQYANLASKTIDIAADSRHFIMFDQPEWFYAKVNTFLAQ